MRGRLWAAIALAASLLAAPSTALAEERITRFISEVRVEPDATLDVTETIEVVAEGVSIRRGIFRDFPTRYRGKSGKQMRVGFALQSVTRNGAAEKSALEAIGNGVRVRIGDAETLLEPGEHRYVIRYRTTRQVGRFPQFDELYWNATGNGWMFPIEAAEAHIHLPQPAKFGSRAVYTGPQGSTASNAELIEEAPGRIAFRTTRPPLAPYEGLTVAVAWPKGVVGEPGQGSRLAWWLSDVGPLVIGALALLGILGFYYHAWRRAGRNPRPGTVVPIFAPADNLTPAAMRYVWKMGADDRAFAAALVDLGVRGHIRMVEEEGGWLSKDKVRLERLATEAPLPDAEEDMLRALVHSGESIMMDQRYHAKFSSAKSALNDSLKKQYEGKLFRRNWGWALAGVAVFIAGLWLTAAAVAAATGVVDLRMVFVALGALLAIAVMLTVIQSIQTGGKCLMVGLMLIFGAIALATGLPILTAAFESGWLLPLVLPLLGLPLVLSAFWWIAAPTREGRAVLDRIAGFRQYLSITEGERLDRMTAPKDTPELFEKLLPYAIALGVENRWAERFHDVLAKASVGQQQQFSWYSGSSSPWNSPGRFVGTVGASLASATASASTAPGSSSGSGGGGSSGGGGGGGGGRGW